VLTARDRLVAISCIVGVHCVRSVHRQLYAGGVSRTAASQPTLFYPLKTQINLNYI
jgi:hypothetical protein